MYLLSKSGTAPPPVSSSSEESHFTSIKCDVTDKDQLNSTLTPIKAQRLINGVIHAAAVFEDVNLESMTFAQLRKVLDPKVSGTLNLHEATLDQLLDFFTMTSSIVSVVHTANQSVTAPQTVSRMPLHGSAAQGTSPRSRWPWV